MRLVGSVVCLVLALGGGYFVLQRSMMSGPVQKPPQEQIDLVGIRQQLLVVGQTERQYLVTHGTYATLEQLAQADLLPVGTESRGYHFSAIVAGSDHFTITATAADAHKTGWPTLEIDESMQLTER